MIKLGIVEGWLSGLRRRTRNAVGEKSPHRFKSCTLRQGSDPTGHHPKGENPTPSVHTMKEFNWKIEERNFMPKTTEWFWALGIFAFALIVFAILLKNYLLIVIVALAALIIYINKNKQPETINFYLDDNGLYIEDKFHSYDSFESFWIFPGEKQEFVLHRKERFIPLLAVPFHENDESQIRKILTDHLPEKEEHESLIDSLSKRFF